MKVFLYADLITKNTSGIFFLVLPAFAYFLSGKALKMLPDKKKQNIINTVYRSAVRYNAGYHYGGGMGERLFYKIHG